MSSKVTRIGIPFNVYVTEDPNSQILKEILEYMSDLTQKYPDRILSARERMYSDVRIIPKAVRMEEESLEMMKNIAENLEITLLEYTATLLYLFFEV